MSVYAYNKCTSTTNLLFCVSPFSMIVVVSLSPSSSECTATETHYRKAYTNKQFYHIMT